MPGLFGIYGLATRSLLSFQNAMHVVGHNVANAGTEGFHRQRIQLRSGPPELTVDGAIGTGVRVDRIQRMEDRFIEFAVRREIPVLARYQARSDALGQAELAFGEPSEGGLSTRLEEFFTGWDDLASSPEDPAAREWVVRLGVSLAESVREAHGRLIQQQDAIRGEIGRAVDDANRAIHELAEVNRSIVASTHGGHIPADLEDRRDRLVETLGDLVGASATVEDDGSAILRMSGRVLVQKANAQEIRFDPAESDRPTLEGRELRTGELDGRIGGLIEVRDEDLGSLIHRLDAFAARLASDVNAIHAQGRDLHGDAGLPFFVLAGVGQDGVTRAAAGLHVNEALVDDPARLAPGADGSDADNVVALDIAALRSGADGPATLLRALVVDVGARAREAGDLAGAQSVVVDGLRAQRESTSGVSLDEEAANLLRYQRSYQAAARILTAVDEMTQTLLAF